EKVYVVWPNKGTRWSSKAYRVGFVALFGFVIVLIVMIIGRIAYIREDRQCVIGLQRGSSLTMLLIDLVVNVLLTGMFVWPLWNSHMLSPNLRRVASRTLVASAAALAISATNMTVLTVLHGRELGWICLASCSTDVVVNAMVLFWLTRPGQAADEPTSHGGIGGAHGPGHRTEPSKSNAVQLQRISAGPGHLGSFGGTTSVHGTSRTSTAVKFKSGSGQLGDMEAGNRSAMKLNLATRSFSEVYDGSQPSYERQGPNTPTRDDKKGTLSPVQTTSVGATDNVDVLVNNTHPPSAYKDQHRHSSGIIYELRVSTEDNNDRSGFFSRMIGRRNGATSPSGRSQNSAGSTVLSPFGGLSGRRRAAKGNYVEEIGVRVTVTTHLEEDIDLANDVASKGKLDSPSSPSNTKLQQREQRP
ncbi:hypothetical protein FRC17_000943, partial [Serendipita sp. 399]